MLRAPEPRLAVGAERREREELQKVLQAVYSESVLSLRQRDCVVQYICEVCTDYRLTPLTSYTAMIYFDRYMAARGVRAIDRTEAELISLTCVLIAAKVRRPQPRPAPPRARARRARPFPARGRRGHLPRAPAPAPRRGSPRSPARAPVAPRSSSSAARPASTTSARSPRRRTPAPTSRRPRCSRWSCCSGGCTW